MSNELNHEGKMCPCCGGPCTGRCWKKIAGMSLFALSLSGSLFLLALFASAVKEYGLIGRDISGQTTISVSADAAEYAAPDIATISFSVTHEAKTQAEARKAVDEGMAKILKLLEEAKVDKKDIKTQGSGYSLYPKYDYVRTPCAYNLSVGSGVSGSMYPCVDGKQVLKGYEVSQSVDVKVRNIDDTGKILGIIADSGATNVVGPNMVLEHEDAVKAKAREEAIKKAKIKAELLAKQLGVSLVRIVSFSEGGDFPIYNYARMGMEMKAMSADAGAPAPASIPVGENKYVSNVTIVYEIR